jgi:hypothetical protein
MFFICTEDDRKLPTRNSISAALMASVAIATVACEDASPKPPQASPSAQTAPAHTADAFPADVDRGGEAARDDGYAPAVDSWRVNDRGSFSLLNRSRKSTQ